MAYFRDIYKNVMDFNYLQGKFLYRDNESNGIPKDAPVTSPYYSWTHYNIEAKITEGLHEMVDQITEEIESNGPYDGVIGFS